ncbi:gibberellin 3-beta-dioxygenase 1-like [Rutidosis leptorrhynchoides]|uniref:gibberellin 3-beta-dioxygenase 1-like n=1 Tax=Rutidosis leptorrhynchoides TaxID=125765 RepID=UPI003A992E8C
MNEPLAVPIIDLSDSQAAELVSSACENWGVFRVINHGISLELHDQAENQTMKLFSLPGDRKVLAARSYGGILGYGLALMSTYFQKVMWLEGFIMSGSPMEHAIRLWPDHEEDRTSFCDVFVKYQKEMKSLSEKLIEVMFSSTGVDLGEELPWMKLRLLY